MEFIVRSIVIGAGATLVMDAWAAALRRFRIPSLDLAMLGRWVGHLIRGRLAHESIALAAPVPGERALGWATHYAIGITFAALLLATAGLGWAHAPTLLPALLVGVVTVAAPLLVLQPALGAGVASRRTAAPLFNASKSVVTHVVFGLGLYLAARVSAP
ncbi:MAG: DUF2938 family protein [Anaeromyxobacter sp.]